MPQTAPIRPFRPRRVRPEVARAVAEATLGPLLKKIANEELGKVLLGQVLPEGTSPGDKVGINGIYVGQYEPKDKKGIRLGKIFNVFAAPEDLTDFKGDPIIGEYLFAFARISQLVSWHGFNGTQYKNDQEIYAAPEDGSYAGGWIIPPREILCGEDVNDNITMLDTLLASRYRGALRDTFKTSTRGNSYNYHPNCYWSSTKHWSIDTANYTADFSKGSNGVADRNRRISCRPVRLVEYKPL